VRVLVVDDETDLADAVATGLRREGYAVDVAYDGSDALDKAMVNAYDLVCLDITMPGVDGTEVCRRIRADELIESQPRILMLTARDALEDRVLGLDSGAGRSARRPRTRSRRTSRRSRSTSRRASSRSRRSGWRTTAAAR
jgi:DNA-binding response OmpR family regulator